MLQGAARLLSHGATTMFELRGVAPGVRDSTNYKFQGANIEDLPRRYRYLGLVIKSLRFGHLRINSYLSHGKGVTQIACHVLVLTNHKLALFGETDQSHRRSGKTLETGTTL